MTAQVRRARKRPIELRYVLYSGFGEGGNGFDVLEWINNNGGQAFGRDGGLYVLTREGRVWADPGDRIFWGTRSEFYPVKPDVFSDVYDDLGLAS